MIRLREEGAPAALRPAGLYGAATEPRPREVQGARFRPAGDDPMARDF